jgi:hypothetical protein
MRERGRDRDDKKNIGEGVREYCRIQT